MTKRIFRAICLVSAEVFLATMLLIMGILYGYFSDMQMRQLKVQTELAAQGLQQGGEAFLKGLDIGYSRISWIGADGSVYYDSQTDAVEMENHLQRQEVAQALESGYGESTRYSTTLMERELYSAKLMDDGTVLRLSCRQYTVLTLLLSTMQPIVLVAVATVGLSLWLAFSLSKRIVKPLNEMDPDNPVMAAEYEELTPMVTRLRSQQNQLRLQEKELRRRQDELDAATSNMAEGLILTNGQGEVLSVNRAAARLLDMDAGSVDKDCLSLRNLPELEGLLRRALQGENGELIITTNGGARQINASPVISDQAVTGAALLIFDVTDKVNAEQMRREFTANVSHELKTPLHTISGCAELLAGDMVKTEDIPRFSQQIYTETKRMIALVEDIIGLSHLDEGAEDMSREDTDLCALAKTTVESLMPTAKEAGVSLEFSGEPAPLRGIPQLLSAIVFNLCDNAIKYNKKGGSVRVTVERLPEDLLLKVEDTGIGIPEEQQEMIFQRFYRVDKSHSKELGGTGLGLSIVKHAAKLHNARIELRSTPGQGTTVEMRFPTDNPSE